MALSRRRFLKGLAVGTIVSAITGRVTLADKPNLREVPKKRVRSRPRPLTGQGVDGSFKMTGNEESLLMYYDELAID